MQFLAWFEADCLPRGYAHLSAGAGIAADTGFSRADAENAKSAQFDEALEDRIHRGLCLGTRQARALDYMMDDVLLNQWSTLVGATGLTVLRLTRLMLQVLFGLWNKGIKEIQLFFYCRSLQLRFLLPARELW
jgi:hypothetical protein